MQGIRITVTLLQIMEGAIQYKLHIQVVEDLAKQAPTMSFTYGGKILMKFENRYFKHE